MNWQVKYALQFLKENFETFAAEHVSDDLIRITAPNKPDVLALILGVRAIDAKMVEPLVHGAPGIDFLCGYRNECVWNGDAIRFLADQNIGWGNFATLTSAAAQGTANTASHKVYSYAEKILRQTKSVVKKIEREYDRVFTVTVKSGRTLRIGLMAEYEPTADVVRTLWDDFNAVDVMWNINPNGKPTKDAIDAGNELGCRVLKWDDLKEYMARA
ncbi:MAG: hypothetical protein KJ947_04185 [Alphaproteobacteria bacterium]|jgi:hypothetical protein|nr:hypothetical protein [Alphaproteobacteria bacterium]MBU1548762.1 hypothetical protein [Alphaproteobacteria bacterium]MBU2335588.1 hypothetical protein [Alphaproteobacteria bacterium]MBU2391017.1 hypothetical protein [Alphaproteobacteria bacterium]|tara:strand:+ start:2202 stop:2846 length:645 start_codon:yes stop_codon:yes gene_type:complete